MDNHSPKKQRKNTKKTWHKIGNILWSEKGQVFSLMAFIIVLFAIYYKTPEDSFFNRLWKVIDPVAGISTFIITLVILYNQLRMRWESRLEKQLDVIYQFTKDSESSILFLVLGAYLSSESDIRAWAQSLANQLVGNIKFDVNWDDPPPKITFNKLKNSYIKSYTVTMHLTANPLETLAGQVKIREFLELKNAMYHSTLYGNENNLPIIWLSKEKEINDLKSDLKGILAIVKANETS